VDEGGERKKEDRRKCEEQRMMKLRGKWGPHAELFDCEKVY